MTTYSPDTLAALTERNVRDALREAVGSLCYAGLVNNGGPRVVAELLLDSQGVRFNVECIENDRVRFDAPIAAVNVGLDRDRVELCRTEDEDGNVFDDQGNLIADPDADEAEMLGQAWAEHVEDNMDRWVSELLEQLAAWRKANNEYVANAVADEYGNDGQRYENRDGVRLEDRCAALAVNKKRSRNYTNTRYEFADGSSLVASDGGWDLGLPGGCFCWAGDRHERDCELVTQD